MCRKIDAWPTYHPRAQSTMYSLRHPACLFAIGGIGVIAIIAGIVCMSLELPAAGVPLIVVFLASSFCYLERSCPYTDKKPQAPLSSIPPPETVVVSVQPT